MGESIEILQGLRVLACRTDGADLVVSLYGGPTCVCGSVRWFGGSSRARLRQLRRWRDQATPVTYVRRAQTVSLVDENALLHDALPEGVGA